MMIIYLLMRIRRLGQLLLPRKAFLATYAPSSEEERLQGQLERNRLRKLAYHLKKVVDK